MPRKPYLSREKTRHGKFVWYFRRGKKRVRLPGDYGTPEFNAAYERALTGTSTATDGRSRSGTLRWLVGQYMRSAAWMSLAPSTRRARGNILKAMLEVSGDVSIADIRRADIKAAIDGKAATPHAANSFLKVVKGLFKWAAEAEYVAVDPTSGVSKTGVKSDGFHTWTIDEVEKYRAAYPVGTRERLAIDLLLFIGLRRGDVIKVGRQHLKDGVISLKTEKTGQWVHVPVFRQLQASIDATKTADLAFLATERGTPFASGASFGNWFSRRVKAAGLPDRCRAHGLRKAGATIAADEGATAHELMAMFGWTRLGMAEVYTKEADKKRLARSAAERLANRV